MTQEGRRTGAKSKDFIHSQGAVGIYEFAQLTGYSYHHVYEMARLGKLQAWKLRGVWMIPKGVLEAALRMNNMQEGSDSGDSGNVEGK